MKKPYLLIIMSLVIVSCQSSKEKTGEEHAEDELHDAVEKYEEREPTDDELNEFGIVTSIEDTGYPMFAIDVEFPERQMTASYTFNVEKSPMNAEELMALNGKYATFYYITEDELQLADVLFEGKTLLGEYGLDEYEGFDTATGKLAGADEPTPGDLPGKVTVTTNSGETLSFKYFVTNEMVAVNEKEVTIYYYEMGVNEITYLWASEN